MFSSPIIPESIKSRFHHVNKRKAIRTDKRSGEWANEMGYLFIPFNSQFVLNSLARVSSSDDIIRTYINVEGWREKNKREKGFSFIT